MKTSRALRKRSAAVSAVAAAALMAVMTWAAPAVTAAAMHPAASDAVLVSHGTTPPSEADCFAVNRRCFTPQAIYASYNLNPVYDAGFDGSGYTIAIVDSYGSDTMAHDLHVFDQAFGLPPMCGEEGVTCAPGMPTFSTFNFPAAVATKTQPGNGTHLEDKAFWAIEVALDVEWAHAIAPGANILLVATNTAETLGVQGFPQMMMAEKYVVDHNMADIISQSFGSAEDAFSSSVSLENLRYAFKAANAADVTVLASSGDDGSAGIKITPVHFGGTLLPVPTVGWPASDPLVTSVGGTYLCTDPNNTTTRVLDASDPPQPRCSQGQEEIGWIAAGGGFSHIFSKPDYQNVLPAGSTPIGSMRGVPDVGYQASATTGILEYLSLPPDGDGSNVGDTGWYDIGGTSIGTPQWAGLVALADQMAGHRLGLINPTLYSIASNPAQYAADYFDVTTGNNGLFAPDVPGYPATTGWDPVTGLGTPNAANLLPDLAGL
ncbi:MAG: S53 family peptidase [Actinomycetota bacterium]